MHFMIKTTHVCIQVSSVSKIMTLKSLGPNLRMTDVDKTNKIKESSNWLKIFHHLGALYTWRVCPYKVTVFDPELKSSTTYISAKLRKYHIYRYKFLLHPICSWCGKPRRTTILLFYWTCVLSTLSVYRLYSLRWKRFLMLRWEWRYASCLPADVP